MKKYYILPILLLIGSVAYSQSLEDAVKFSRLSSQGTARSAAMGGAFGALGGDISSLSFNPAGIGVFRKSEFAFTPLLNFTHTNSGHGNIKDNTFQVGQLGIVFGFHSPNSNWKGFNFGINYTNLNNFNQKQDQLVDYSENSITNVWVLNSIGYAPAQIPDAGSIMAYDTKLIYLLPDDNKEYNYLSILEQADAEGYYNAPVAQQQMIKEDGYQGEYAFSFGTNYKDKLYLGMTVGLQSLYYKLKSTYIEAVAEDSPTGLSDFIYEQHNKVSGVGTNLKFGLIYRPIPQIRLGAAIHTPTWYNISYDYNTSLDALYTFADPEKGRDETNYFSYGSYSTDYDLRTPWRAILSAATVLGQKAIISADYEYVDYTSAKYSSGDGYDSEYENALNQQVKYYLRATHNFRVGAEYRFNSILSLRAGYNFQASPYQDDGNNNRIQTLSAGLGLNFGMFYCDAAYVHKYYKNQSVFYSGYYPEFDDFYIESTPVTNKFYNNEARLTVGVRF